MNSTTPANKLNRSSNWSGSAVALFSAGLLVWLWGASDQIVPGALLTSFLIIGANLLVALVVASIVTLLLAVTIGRRFQLSKGYTWAFLSVAILLGTLGAGASVKGWVILVVLLMVISSVIGGTLWPIITGGWKRGQTELKRPRNLLGLIVSVALLIAVSSWIVSPGPRRSDIQNAAKLGSVVAPLQQANPSQPGSYQVASLTYGSGKDLQQPEYGKNVTIKTTSVDGSKIIQGWTGFSGSARTKLWGFNQTALPVNGRVWYPKGSGSFPLVLIVHGNQSSVQISDTGYAYLGQLLASRGYIVASVDENFLNTGLIDKAGGLSGVNAARGWLLLEHLKDWQAWNNQPSSPFYQKIDTNNIALIGHSRGGEAVAVAADLNKLDHYPENPSLKFDYHFNIKSIIAIAPADGQYLPGGKKVALQDVNYLVLQGSHDADVNSFGGLNQYQRTSFTAGSNYIKAALYIDGADHDQFNTVWGNHDVGQGLAKHFIDTGALLKPTDQRAIAQVYSSAFLDDTLRGQTTYQPLFQDYRTGSAWLPNTVYINQFAAATSTYVATYQKDSATQTNILNSSTQKTTAPAKLTEENLNLRGGPGDSRVAQLDWKTAAGQHPAYTISFPAGSVPKTTLRFDMADITTASHSPVNLTIELRDAAGNSASLPLKHSMPLQSPIIGQYLKSSFLHNAPLSEPVMQTYSFPLGAFKVANQAFDPATLTTIAYNFDDTPSGSIILDNIGVE